jgi:hypothetical protein
MVRTAQLAAVFVALVLVPGAGIYAITRAIIPDGSSWGRLEIIEAVLDYARGEPCNHPDPLTARAKLTTVEQRLEIIANRFGHPYLGGSGTRQPDYAESASSAERPIWLVELRGDIPVLGIRGDPNACNPTPTPTLAYYFVDLNGEVTTTYGTSDE